jgi:hypothetical protein
MFAQLKYSSRLFLNQRLFALCATILLNLGFFALGSAGLLPYGWMVAGEVFSSLAMTGLFVVCIIADVQSISSLFSAPDGYAVALTPVPGWKVILGRVIPMVVFDLISYAVGITGIILQSMLLSDWGGGSYGIVGSETVLSILLGVIGYLTLLLLIIFCCAFAKSVLFHLKGRGILGFGAALVLVYAGNWLDMVLAPFANVSRVGAFVSIEIISGSAGSVAYLCLTLIKAAALFIGASYLYERRKNL